MISLYLINMHKKSKEIIKSDFMSNQKGSWCYLNLFLIFTKNIFNDFLEIMVLRTLFCEHAL
jgi:hypothetical protein